MVITMKFIKKKKNWSFAFCTEFEEFDKEEKYLNIKISDRIYQRLQND